MSDDRRYVTYRTPGFLNALQIRVLQLWMLYFFDDCDTI